MDTTAPQSRTVRISERSLLAKIAARRLRTQNMALVIGHTIHLHGVSADEFLARRSWVCHELRHVEQYERYGMIGFLLRYLIESIRHGYRDNALEAEARASEQDCSLMQRYSILPPPQSPSPH